MTWNVLASTNDFDLTDEPTQTLAAAGCTLVDSPYGAPAPSLSDVGLGGAELIEAFRDVDAAIVGAPEMTAEVIAALPRLKMISRRGVGYDTIDVAAATEAGIVVTITPGGQDDGVAEHVFALLLAVARWMVVSHNDLVDGVWLRRQGTELVGKTLGLVGLGRIGRKVAVRARAFGLSVIAADPAADASWAREHDVSLGSIDDVLAAADFVSLHAPLLESTRHLIGGEQLARMKRSAILVNTSRGPVVDQAALIRALSDGVIRGAGLDTFDPEPPDPETTATLAALPNVVMTPHVGGATAEGTARGSRLAAGLVAAAARGERPRADCVVNPDVFERHPHWPER
jgi:D-3-phosphoglycerate dehydrogenase